MIVEVARFGLYIYTPAIHSREDASPALQAEFATIAQRLQGTKH